MLIIIIRTILPIFLLIGLGFLARHRGIFKAGDERIFNVYIYYFSLPALFFINLSETVFNQSTVRFVLYAVIPLFIILLIYILITVIFRLQIEKLYILITSSVFGSVAFFGIPFIIFAFTTEEAEHLAVLAAACLSAVGVTISVTILEVYKLKKLGEPSFWLGLKMVLKRFTRNPLIISIIFGVFLSLIKVKIPTPLATTLHMLGKTTATVAIFMLGIFLYGRKYTNIFRAVSLSFLRIIFLPIIALIVVKLAGLPRLEASIIVLMNAMPVAISMIVLSERYDFEKETIASLILISTLAAAIYLNIWLILL